MRSPPFWETSRDGHGSVIGSSTVPWWTSTWVRWLGSRLWMTLATLSSWASSCFTHLSSTNLATMTHRRSGYQKKHSIDKTVIWKLWYGPIDFPHFAQMGRLVQSWSGKVSQFWNQKIIYSETRHTKKAFLEGTKPESRDWLVVDLYPPEKYESQLEWLFPIYGKS